MSQPNEYLTVHRRRMLADKGRRLYAKYCGTRGRGICAESFACYHIARGEAEVAEDLLAFLEPLVVSLEQADPDGRLVMTRRLVARIRGHLQEAAAGCRPS